MILVAELNHLQPILEIERASFDRPWTEYHFKNDIQNDCSLNWVYEKDTHIIGFLFGWHILDEYHLNNIAINGNYRRQGFAQELFKHVVNDLRINEVKSMLLEVSATNLPARKLYEKLGFEAHGERKDYYTKGDDAVLYSLSL